MSKLIGARVPRLEDHALLTGRGRFVDDIAAAGVLAAAFVRSPHPHALIRGVDAAAARALPGVVAVLTLDDLAPVMKAAAHGPGLEFRHQTRPQLAVRAGRRRSVLRRRAGRHRPRRRPLCRRGRGGAGRRRLRRQAGGDGLPRRARAGGAPRARLEPGHRLPGRLWRCRSGLRQGRPGRARRLMDPSRLRAFDGRARHPGANFRSRDRRLGVDAEGARSAHRVCRLYRSRRKPAAGGDAGRRRRFRAEAVRLSRGRCGGRRGDAHSPLGQMDRRPPRIFHQCGAGARPVLVDRARCRRRRARARFARPAHPRHRRLRVARREHPVQFGDHADRPLYRAGAGDGRGRDPYQQGAGFFGTRRRLSAGGVRHGAHDGSAWRGR